MLDELELLDEENDDNFEPDQEGTNTHMHFRYIGICSLLGNVSSFRLEVYVHCP